LQKRHGQTANLEQRRRNVAEGKLLVQNVPSAVRPLRTVVLSDPSPPATQMDKLSRNQIAYADSSRTLRQSEMRRASSRAILDGSG
jgi:hypothetical protein